MKFSTDYPALESQPRGLTKEEVKNPYQVLDEFFDYASLVERRQMLWLWFETTVTDSFSLRSDRRDRQWIASSYTDLQKLVEAAYLLHDIHQNQIRKHDSQTPGC